jgi:hypothetical protein
MRIPWWILSAERAGSASPLDARITRARTAKRALMRASFGYSSRAFFVGVSIEARPARSFNAAADAAAQRSRWREDCSTFAAQRP